MKPKGDELDSLYYPTWMGIGIDYRWLRYLHFNGIIDRYHIAKAQS